MPKNALLLKIISIFLALALTISCNPQPEEIELSFETIEQEDMSVPSGVYKDHPEIILISSKIEMIRLENLIGEQSIMTLEQISYSDYFGVVVFQGRMPSSGYGVNLDRITRVGNIISVFAQFIEPEYEQIVLDIITSPYQVVRVKKGEGEWGQDMVVNLIVDNSIVASTNYFIP